MYCKRCGAKLDDGASYCTSCGASQRDPGSDGSYQQSNYGGSQYDSGSFGWFILGFFIPMVGLILWIVWMHDRPRSARMSGLGALVSVIVWIILPIIIFIAVVAAGVSTEAVLALI